MFELAASGGPESFGVLSVRPTVPADLLSTFLLQGHSRCHPYSTFRKEEGDNTRAHGDRKERAHRARPQPFCCVRAEPPGLLLVQPRHPQTPVPVTLCHPVSPHATRLPPRAADPTSPSQCSSAAAASPFPPRT